MSEMVRVKTDETLGGWKTMRKTKSQDYNMYTYRSWSLEV